MIRSHQLHYCVIVHTETEIRRYSVEHTLKVLEMKLCGVAKPEEFRPFDLSLACQPPFACILIDFFGKLSATRVWSSGLHFGTVLQHNAKYRSLEE